jgi:hypothetical protein
MKFAIAMFLSCLLISQAKTHGSKITMEKSIPLSSAIKNFDSFKNQEILVTGKVSEVCQKKGCWINLKEGEQTVKIEFKDYGFFVPFSLRGKSVRAQGKLQQKTLSESEQKHYLKDAGKDQKEVQRVKEPIMVFSFVANGLEVI